MRVLILGDSEINPVLEKKLTRAGRPATTIADSGHVLKCKGEAGRYWITTQAETFSVSSVIITEPEGFEALEIDGAATYNLMDATVFENLSRGKKKAPVALLLDYASETPEHITSKAIDLAIKLADQKRDVVFLSKFVKSAEPDREEAYRKARNAGVSFFKYESARLSYSEDCQAFKIEACDGAFSVALETPYVLSVQRGANPALTAAARKCGLRYQAPDSLNDGRFFLNPVFTTRRGIYYVNSSRIAPPVEKGVNEALRAILGDMSAFAGEGTVPKEPATPEIDASKCAFCYTCYRACPHAALAPDLENSAMKTLAIACQACGICVAICPGEAVSGKERTEKPGSEKREARACKVFCCENGAWQAYEEIAPELGEIAARIDAEPVSCGGRVGADVLTRTLAAYETALIACCHEGACRHIDGERHARKQVERTVALLDKAALTGKKVEIVKVSHAARNVLKDKIIDLLESGANAEEG